MSAGREPDAEQLDGAALRRFVELFGAGQFFASHEVLEARWLITRDPFQRGLIILAAAFVQRDRGNLRGCKRQLQKARRYLADHQPQHQGLNVHGLIAELDRCVAHLDQHPDDACRMQPPVLRLRVGSGYGGRGGCAG